MRPGTYRSALAQPEFRRLILAYGVAAVGQSFGTLATAVVMFERTHSAAWVGAIGAARVLPFVMVPGLAGVVAARVPRRALLMGSALARALLAGALALAIAQHASPIVLVALAFVFTACGTPSYPALAAAVPETLPASELAPGNGLLTSVENLADVVGPALGGVVLLTGSAAWALTVNALVFVAAFALAGLVQAAPAAMRATKSVRDELRNELSAFRSAPDVTESVVLVVVVNLVYGGALVALVLYADRVLDGGSGGYGVLTVGLGLGAFAAVATTNRLAAARRQLLVLGAMTLLGGVPFALLAGVSELWIATLLMVAAGAGGVATEVLTITLVQRQTDRERVAQVVGLLDSLIFGAMFLGSLVTPLLVRFLGLQTTLAVIGGVLPGIALLLVRRLSRAPRGLSGEIAARVQLMTGVPWLRGALRPAVEALALDATEEHVREGTVVIEQGADADDFFVIVSGRVVVVKNGETVALLGPGEGFGEIGLLEGVPRTATVVARWPSVLLRVQGEQFVATVNAVAPAAGGTLAGGLLSRLGGGRAA